VPDNQIWINVIGTAAGLCSMTSFVPQIMKIWRDKDASSVSLHMFAVTVTAFALWCAYGIALSSWPIVLSNAVCFILSAAIMMLRLKFGDSSAGSNSKRRVQHP
jgi:MtN3 and saliva related transmembrane protein